MQKKLKPGLYRHFKGGLYTVIGIAKHSETGEDMVVYQAVSGDRAIWVRPYEMFIGPVDHEKYPDVAQIERFEYLGDQTV